MAITPIGGSKKIVWCRVQNVWEPGDTVVACDPETTGIVGDGHKLAKIESHQDPLVFFSDGQRYQLDRGDSVNLPVGIVKHLVGDWDIENPEEWEQEQMRVLGNRCFIPKLKIEVIETQEEVEKRTHDQWSKVKYQKPQVGKVEGKAAARQPVVMTPEDQKSAFIEEEMKEAETKKRGRPPKEAASG